MADVGARMIRRCRPLLGTFVDVSVDEAAAHAIDVAFLAIEQVQGLMSFHSETSDLARLRGADVGRVVEVDPATITTLRAALALYRATDGLFDMSIGRALVASGFLPHPEGMDLRRCTGTSADIEIVDDQHVRLHKLMLIDLGGIAKGYAVDCAVAALKAAGAAQGIVNAGGDLRVFGAQGFPIALRGADGSLAREIGLTNTAIASSSNLHTRRRLRGKETSPHIGAHHQPLLADHAVHCIAPDCLTADAMTKVALANPALAKLLLAEHGGEMIVTHHITMPQRFAA